LFAILCIFLAAFKSRNEWFDHAVVMVRALNRAWNANATMATKIADITMSLGLFVLQCSITLLNNLVYQLIVCPATFVVDVIYALAKYLILPVQAIGAASDKFLTTLLSGSPAGVPQAAAPAVAAAVVG